MEENKGDSKMKKSEFWKKADYYLSFTIYGFFFWVFLSAFENTFLELNKLDFNNPFNVFFTLFLIFLFNVMITIDLLKKFLDWLGNKK